MVGKRSNFSLPTWIISSGIFLFAPLLVAQDNQEKIELLKQQIKKLEARIEALENKNPTSSSPQLATPTASTPSSQAPPQESRAEGPFAQSEDSIAEDAPLSQKTKDSLNWKGALRFTTYVTDYDDNGKSRYGDSGLDLFRIGVEGNHGDFLISAEYRWYPYMETLHHGWLGYELSNGDQLQLGVSKVPFGIQPYAAHNFWFGIPYYIGLSDDYDLGLQFAREAGPWNFNLAFYKNEELGSATNLDRYSFDVVQSGLQQNKETNQFNARSAYTFGKGTNAVHELGISAQWGQLYNDTTGNTGDHYAIGGHLDSRMGRWNFQFQVAHYRYNPKNPAGVSNNTVQLGAFGGTYDIAAEGTVATVNTAYNLPVPWSWLDQILIYNDYSILFKRFGYEESQLNTTGAAFGIGPLFIYIDLIHARNMVYFEDGSLSGKGNHSWSRRFNLNVGYYW